MLYHVLERFTFVIFVFCQFGFCSSEKFNIGEWLILDQKGLKCLFKYKH